MIIRSILIALLFLSAPQLMAQEADTVTQDEAAEFETSTEYVSAASDTLAIDKKSFADEKLRELKNDPNLNYEQLPTVAETLWDRILRWLSQFLQSFFEGAYNTNWGRVLLYAGLVALIVVLVMMVLKVDAFRILYSRAGSSPKLDVLDENIHEMDFERLIQESIDQQNFRKAIRLVFLYSLKLLSDRQLILWESGKTNHDYVGELQQKELKSGLNELSFYFDYAWYGNFQVNRDTFNKVQSTFQDFKSKL